MDDSLNPNAQYRGSPSHVKGLLARIWDPATPGQPVPMALPRRREGEPYSTYMDRVEQARKQARDEGRGVDFFVKDVHAYNRQADAAHRKGPCTLKKNPKP